MGHRADDGIIRLNRSSRAGVQIFSWNQAEGKEVSGFKTRREAELGLWKGSLLECCGECLVISQVLSPHLRESCSLYRFPSFQEGFETVLGNIKKMGDS